MLGAVKLDPEAVDHRAQSSGMPDKAIGSC